MTIIPDTKRYVGMFYLEVANGSLMSVTLQHDLDVLHSLLPDRTGAGHLIGYLLCSFLQLEMRPNCEERAIVTNCIWIDFSISKKNK